MSDFPKKTSSPEFDKLVETGAKALYEHQVKTARAEIDRRSFDLVELKEFILKIRIESETAQVLVFYSYLDDRIRTLMQDMFLEIENKAAMDRLFGVNAPLDTFSNRTLLAYHLGWLSFETKGQLDAFRKIRNEFAHRAFRVSLKDPALAEAALTIGHENAVAAALKAANPDGKLEYPDRNRNLLLCRLLMLALRTFEDLLVLPVARQFRVAPGSITGSFDEAPELVRRLSRATAAAVMLAAGIHQYDDIHVW